ncbi:MAG TPA: T9SS type A sorting domain-containing protein [Bacteroidales bacterium]|nr:T9SS type A sorting domain-containing protein [Bacteroidales bacterium]
MTRKSILYLLLISLSPAALRAQEIVTGLQYNTVLSKQDVMKASKGTMANEISLPFFDDFSYNNPVPDQGKWEDKYVFVNNTYSNKQITKGVATFDILDSHGAMYDMQTPSGFAADRLTSRPVNLQYPASSNIRLSFLFEAGGLSDSPETNDSLSLQFFSPSENSWYRVWSTKGTERKGFRNVIIHINNQRYLQKGFRFRFINYASIARNIMDPSMIGNCDIWNLDYVLLDAGRSAGDTIYSDVAFTLPTRSLLRNYEAMPWKQFREAVFLEMGLAIPVTYRNNDNIVRNVTRTFQIRDVYQNAVVHSFSGGAQNTEPGSDVSYKANLIYTFNTSFADSALFMIRSSLKTDEFDPKINDTIVYYQHFGDYFAYDDGSSEGGYGLNGLGSRNAMFAHRFTSYTEDTLRAIDIIFNDSFQDANKRAFDIMVWDDSNGNPGNVIYRKEEVMVESGTSINGFYRYYFTEGIPVEGDFYIGWKQRSETFLNAGFDVNTPHKGRQFFWLNGNWNISQVEGSVMIHPVLGMPLLTGIRENVLERKSVLKIWPNPAGDYITLSIEDWPVKSSAYISVFDLAGHELIRAPFSEVFDISRLSKGMYIVITQIDGRRAGINRLIKSR